MPEQTDLPIDRTLTPENATERGYLWLYDIFDGMIHSIIVQSLVEEGYKLGKASETRYLVSVGVYQPLTPQTTPQQHEQ